MTDLPHEHLVFLTAQTDKVPLGWTSILEQELLPPLRHATWPDLLSAQRRPDIVFVFSDCFEQDKPSRAAIKQALPGTGWIAVIESPDAGKLREAYAAGYDEVFDAAAAPALVLGPLLRLREKRQTVAQEQKLLEESLAAYQELSALDRVRESLRVLDLQELAPRLVRDLAEILGERDGTLWLPADDAETTGSLRPIRAEGARFLANQVMLSLHALPCAADLLNGKIVQVDWRERKVVFVPIVEADLLLALVELPRHGSATALLNREETRLRMLRDWLKIALQNSLEAEQMRKVLRSRFGDFFSPESFAQHLQKALLQASRYHRPLTLVALDFDGPERTRKKVFQYILELLRDADVFEEPQGSSARIFLPETGYLGGVQFLRRIQRELQQKFPGGTLKNLATTLASYPWHGRDAQALYANLADSLAAVGGAKAGLAAIKSERIHRLVDALTKNNAVQSLHDPNIWADLAYHLVQETGLIEPDSTRMLLFLGSHAESLKLFSTLLEYPARWDRILVSAAVTGDKEATAGPMNIVRDPNMTNTYLAMIERPTGALAAWVRADKPGDAWRGGLCRDVHLVRALFNRFEDQYLLHHKWVQ